MHKVPVVDVQVLLDAGAARDPADLPGLATFTAAMLQQGAGTRGALDVADEAAFLGAQLNTTATADGAVASLHVPRRRLEAALDLLADVVLRPTFSDSEVARQRELRGAQLVQQRDEPVAVASVAFPAIVYGPAPPYGHPLDGTDAAPSTPDWYCPEVLNTILGGAFTSRLNQNLRETHGYTYGAFSQFAARRLAGAFVALASVVTAKTDSSLIEFLKELRRIREAPVPEGELAKAKAYVTLGLPGDFETTGGAAARFRDVLGYGLPLDYYDRYIERIGAV